MNTNDVSEGTDATSKIARLVIGVLVLGGLLIWGVGLSDMFAGVIADDPYEADFEDACNDRFGYEWEYEDGSMQKIEGGDRAHITCEKDTGFLSSTEEEITVDLDVPVLKTTATGPPPSWAVVIAAGVVAVAVLGLFIWILRWPSEWSDQG